MSTTPPAAVTVKLPATAKKDSATIESVLVRANRDNPSEETRAELRRIFDEHPAFYQSIADSIQSVNRGIVESMSKNGVTQETYFRRVAAQREQLGYHEAPPLERPLIDHVVTCWLRLQRAEYAYTTVTAQSITLTKDLHYERKLTQAQARYLRAVETLARVRRLARPAAPVQVNIADRQVNQVLTMPSNADEQQALGHILPDRE